MRYNCLFWRASVGAILAGVVAFSSRAYAVTINFEDVSLPSSDYYNGSDGAGSESRPLFSNYYTSNVYNGITYTYWDNWACSRKTDVTTGDFTNQFSAIAGTGASGSVQYAVGFPSFTTNLCTISLANPGTVQGASSPILLTIIYPCLMDTMGQKSSAAIPAPIRTGSN